MFEEHPGFGFGVWCLFALIGLAVLQAVGVIGLPVAGGLLAALVVVYFVGVAILSS